MKIIVSDNMISFRDISVSEFLKLNKCLFTYEKKKKFKKK